MLACCWVGQCISKLTQWTNPQCSICFLLNCVFPKKIIIKTVYDKLFLSGPILIYSSSICRFKITFKCNYLIKVIWWQFAIMKCYRPASWYSSAKECSNIKWTMPVIFYYSDEDHWIIIFCMGYCYAYKQSPIVLQGLHIQLSSQSFHSK